MQWAARGTERALWVRPCPQFRGARTVLRPATHLWRAMMMPRGMRPAKAATMSAECATTMALTLLACTLTEPAGRARHEQ